jgi:hypothetical protein
MFKRNSNLSLVYLLVLTSLTAGCQTHSAAGNVQGAVEVHDEQLKGPWPAELPRTVYVSDFRLDAAHFEGDQGAGGMLPGRILGRFAQRVPHPLTDSEPEQQVQKIVTEMSQSLISSLRDKGFMAQRIANPETALPHDGWLLQGVFTEVDEGNRIKRAVIGFGRGATSMQVQVGVSDLASARPREPFIIFGTVKDPKEIPGAVVTMNPYVAAARFVMEKNATAKDIRKTAEQIVAEILKHTQKFQEQAGKTH